MGGRDNNADRTLGPGGNKSQCELVGERLYLVFDTPRFHLYIYIYMCVCVCVCGLHGGRTSVMRSGSKQYAKRSKAPLCCVHRAFGGG